MDDELRQDYFFDLETKIIFWAKSFPHSTGMTYIGTSDNPNKKMAAQVFMRRHTKLTGWQIREYVQK